MNREWQDIDDLFREGIKDFTNAPFPDSWYSIQNKVNEAKRREYRKKRRRYFYGVTAALLFITSSFLAYNKITEFQSDGSYTKSGITQAKNTYTTAGEKNNRIGTSQVDPLDLAKENPSSVEHEGSDQPYKTNFSAPNTSVSKSVSKKGSMPGSQATPTEKSVTIQHIQEQNGGFAGSEQEKSSSENNIIAPDTLLSQQDIALIDGKKDFLLKENILPGDEKYSGKLSEVTPPVEQEKFRISAYVKPSIGYRYIAPRSNDGRIVARERSSDVPETSVSGTVLIEKNIWKGLYIGTGINYINTGVKYYKKKYALSRLGHMPTNSPGTAPSYTISPKDSSLVKNSLRYIGVPVTVGLEKRFGRFSVYAFTGVSANYLVKASDQELYSELKVVYGDIKYKNISSPMKRITFSNWSSIDLRYQVSPSVSIGAGPDFNYFISSSVSSESLRYHPYQVGFHASLSSSF